jgi:hypothetical protein
MNSPSDRVMDDLRREVHKYVLLDTRRKAEAAEPTSLARVRQAQAVNPHLPIGWPAMPRNPVRRIPLYIMKLVRRLLRWYINPLVEQQNRFNEAAVATLSELHSTMRANEQALFDAQEALRAATLEIEQLRLRVDDAKRG